MLPVIAASATASDGATHVQQLLHEADQLTRRWDQLPSASIRAILSRLLHRVVVHSDRVDVSLQPNRVSKVLSGDTD